jgi:hypothetical protein
MNEPDSLQPDVTVPTASLVEESNREAREFRWYESERAGCDQGEYAIRKWVHCHWPGFLRARWIEHMLGIRFWLELKRNEFGLLCREFGDSRPLLDAIILQLKCGAENLDIIRWARRETCQTDQRRVRELLRLIDVNSHRLRCFFFDD